jgi:hypothetical protein
MLVEVAIVSLSKEFPELGCPVHSGNNRIKDNQVLNKAEMQSLSSLYRCSNNIYHNGYVSHIVA